MVVVILLPMILANQVGATISKQIVVSEIDEYSGAQGQTKRLVSQIY